MSSTADYHTIEGEIDFAVEILLKLMSDFRKHIYLFLPVLYFHKTLPRVKIAFLIYFFYYRGLK
jgi:hypothetical protein